MLSYADLTNTEYGFESDRGEYDISRMMVTSDYSRAVGVGFNVHHGTAYWWLRSPQNERYYTEIVDSYGNIISFLAVDHFGYGVVPAIQIELA